MKYGFCQNHTEKLAVNAKRLCLECTKLRHKKSAESKGLTIKEKENERNVRKDGLGFEESYSSERQNSKVIEKNIFAIKKTKIKHRSDKGKELARQELLLFQKLFQERPSTCEYCGTEITIFSPINYHHVRTKGSHPELRLVESNIVKICAECHLKEHGFRPTGKLNIK